MRLRGNRDGIVPSTKGGHPPVTDTGSLRLSRRDIRSDLEASLRALATGAVDVSYVHRDDSIAAAGARLDPAIVVQLDAAADDAT